MQIKYIFVEKNAMKEDMSWKFEARMIGSYTWACFTSYNSLLSSWSVSVSNAFYGGLYQSGGSGQQIKDI